MTPCDAITQTWTESLVELELKIARRADELAAVAFAPSSLNLFCWLQAEQEILGPALHNKALIEVSA